MIHRRFFAAPFAALTVAVSVPLLVSASCAIPLGAVAAQEPITITTFDAPFLFTYLTWDKKATITGGRAVLNAPGMSPKGGGGVNVALDLSRGANLCPVVRVKVGAKNTLKSLRLLLLDDSAGETADSKKRGATFEFLLPETPTADFVTIYARSGATLVRPNTPGAAGTVNPAKIIQWQLIGDWTGDGAVDIEVDSVVLAEPDAATKAVQADAAKQEQERNARIARENAGQREKYGKRSPNSPHVVEVYRVAPDILAVGIQAGQVIPGRYEPYTPQPGDETRKSGDRELILKRGGAEIGWLVGKKNDGLVYFETFVGDPLLDEGIESADSFTVLPGSGAGIKPVAVYRKSKPTDQVQPGATLAMRHVVYLKLPAPLEIGKTYTVRFADAVNVARAQTAPFTLSDTATRSEAVHVPQIGFRADDPAKTGFLSIWLGTGGGYEYATPPAFHVVDAKTGKSVLTGVATLAKGKDAPDKMWQGKPANYAKTAVYHLDFSALTTPGTYRVAVDGVGCSYPFPIGRDTWRKAFVTQMRGLFHNRGGVTLGAPYTTFKKPRSLVPGVDTQVFETAYNVVDGGKSEAGEALEKGSTGKPVPGAWGGYHDAGDFNPRRVTHMRVTMAHLELLDVFPAYFAGVKLNIPARPGVPDVLTEALFELELFRRLQKPDGGVPYQIETNGDPVAHEVSWKHTKDGYVTAPDPWASWYYAGVAAKAAKLLQKYDPKLAATYRDSATKAMNWAETDYAKRKKTGTADKIKWEMTDARNYAALLLYDLTGENRWHDIFLENTVLKTEGANLYQWGTAVQRDAAFLYATLSPARKPDARLKAHAVAGLKQQADAALAYADGNAYRIATPDAGKPMFIGFWSTPDAIELCRAHFLTGDKKYLAGAVQACAFAAGGNPSNITYTTGVGTNPVKHPFQIDSRATGQPAPEGLTVYGNFDWPDWPDQQWALWPMQYSLGPGCRPNAYEWPVPEAYFDIYLYPATNEFTVDAWTPNVYVWGYLAARK